MPNPLKFTAPKTSFSSRDAYILRPVCSASRFRRLIPITQPLTSTFTWEMLIQVSRENRSVLITENGFALTLAPFNDNHSREFVPFPILIPPVLPPTAKTRDAVGKDD